MEKTFVCTAAISHELFPGRHVSVLNVGPDAPMPDGIAWALRPLAAGVPVIDPFVIDAAQQAREARDAEAFRVEASKPRHSYTSSDVADRLGLSLDELTEVLHHCGLPKPRQGHEVDGGANVLLRVVHFFDGPDIDRYVERVERLFGGRSKRKAAK